MSPKLSRLPRLVSIQPDEALLSYLVRLSAANSYDPVDLKLMIGTIKTAFQPNESPLFPIHQQSIRELQILTHCNEEALYASLEHRWAVLFTPPQYSLQILLLPSGKSMPRLTYSGWHSHVWLNNNLPYCPFCLQEKNYYRLSWLLLASPVCLKHHRVMAQGCPQCGNPLTIPEILSNVCPICEADLPGAPTFSVVNDTEGLRAHTLLQTWIAHPQSISQPQEFFPNTSSAILYQIAFGIQRAIRTIDFRWDYVHIPPDVGNVRIFPGKHKNTLTPLQAYSFFATAVQGMLDFPVNFHRLLHAFTLRDNREPTDTVRADLGYFNTMRTHAFWKQPAFEPVRSAVQIFVKTHYPYSLTMHELRRRSPHQPIPAHPEYVSLSNAAKRLNTTRAIVERLVDLGYLDGTRRTSNLVLYQQVLRLQESWRDGIPIDVVALILGVAEAEVTALAEVELLHSPHEGIIGSSSIGNLITSLRRVVRYRYGDISSANTMAQTTQQMALTVADIIQKILDGELTAIWTPHQMDMEHLAIIENE